MIGNEDFMTINIFVLKGDLNGKSCSGVFLFLLGIYKEFYLTYTLPTRGKDKNEQLHVRRQVTTLLC